MHAFRAFLCVGFVALGAHGQDLPAPLRHLETLAADEQQLVDAARRFDQQQHALITWDRKLIAEYMESGQTDLVATKQEDIRRRANQIKACWEYVLERYPNSARANNYYGEYLYDLEGNQIDALSHWRTARQLDPEFAPPYNNLGIHSFHSGDYERGLSYLEKALELDEENPDYLYNMVQMYMIHFPQIEAIKERPREKLYKDAMEMAELAAELAPDDFDIVQDYAVSFFAAQNFGLEADWETAVEAWRKVVPLARNDEESFYANLNLARVLLRAGSPKLAEEAIETALRLRPDSDVAKRLLDEAQRATG